MTDYIYVYVYIYVWDDDSRFDIAISLQDEIDPLVMSSQLLGATRNESWPRMSRVFFLGAACAVVDDKS